MKIIDICYAKFIKGGADRRLVKSFKIKMRNYNLKLKLIFFLIWFFGIFGVEKISWTAPWTVSTSVNWGSGIINCTSPVADGQTMTCTASPGDGYVTSYISGCGGTWDWNSRNAYKTGAVTANCTVTAAFTKCVWDGSGGSDPGTCWTRTGSGDGSYIYTTVDPGQDAVYKTMAAAGSSDGNTVILPIGVATWTWEIDANEGITLQGSGTLGSGTIITIQGGSLRGYGTTTAHPFRLTNIYFRFINTYGLSFGNWNGSGWFRVDHNKIDTINGGYLKTMMLYAHGVIDSNTITNIGWQVNWSYPNDLSVNNTAWVAGPQWGTNNAIFFENNTITQNGQNNDMDCSYAGRVVYRYNTMIGMFGNHGAEIGTGRGCQRQDVYNNIILAPETGTYSAVQFRGGTGMVYNNVIDNGSSGSFINWILFQDYCSASTHPCADTSRCSPTGPVYYPFCYDQVGVGTGAWGSQIRNPIYMWNNCSTSLGCGTGAGNRSTTVENIDYETAHIQDGREFFSRTDGTLHGYTPYTCPHPLTGYTGSCDSSVAGTAGYNISSSDTTPPAAPTGLAVN